MRNRLTATALPYWLTKYETMKYLHFKITFITLTFRNTFHVSNRNVNCLKVKMNQTFRKTISAFGKTLCEHFLFRERKMIKNVDICKHVFAKKYFKKLKNKIYFRKPYSSARRKLKANLEKQKNRKDTYTRNKA